jgi:hypothetical protein
MLFGLPASDAQGTGGGASNAAFTPVASAGMTDEASTESDAVISECRVTVKGDDAARNNNIKLACESVNGSVLRPDRTFSFNESLGDIENDDRYLIAPVIDGVFKSYGQGGGICVLSSALYVAALDADMTIEERNAHSIAVDYVELGFDATVYSDASVTLDLRFTNASEFPVTINAEFDGQELVVQFIGHPLQDGVSIEMISRIVGYFDAEGAERDASAGLAKLSGSTFCRVETFRAYYRHGEEVSRQMLSSDRYLVARDGKLAVTTGGAGIAK